MPQNMSRDIYSKMVSFIKDFTYIPVKPLTVDALGTLVATPGMRVANNRTLYALTQMPSALAAGNFLTEIPCVPENPNLLHCMVWSDLAVVCS